MWNEEWEENDGDSRFESGNEDRNADGNEEEEWWEEDNRPSYLEF